MPKRRGRSTAGASRPTATPAAGDIGELIRRMQGIFSASEGGPQRSSGVSEAVEIPPGLETSLSPDVRAPPPQPQLSSSPRGKVTPEVGVLSSPEASSPSQSLLTGAPMDKSSFEEAEGESSERRVNLQGQRQVIQLDGEHYDFSLPVISLEKPSEVTLDSLWDLMAGLVKTISPKLQLIEGKLSQHSTELKELRKDMTASNSSVQKLEQDIKSSKQLQESLMKDNINLRRKMENLENNSRYNNLRIINFPKLPLTPPREMFKRYFLEVLGASEDSLPPLSRVYYLPNKTKLPKKPSDQGLLDVSELLEKSDKEVVESSTLIITVALSIDKVWLLKLFFKNRQKEFMGCKVQVFPDLSRETQRRRREFLLLKPGVISLGATFYLRHPCKCIVHHRSVKYVFFEPNQLTSFLALSRLEVEKS